MAEETTQQPKAFTLPPSPELSAVQGQMGGFPGLPDFEKFRKETKTSREADIALAPQLQKVAELEQQIGAGQLAQKTYEAESLSSIARQKREESQRIEQGLDDIRKKFPYEEFHPTTDNIQSIAGLFSVIGVVGMAMGGSGKQSATLALNAMAGMMKGWKEGRADLFKREKEEYDKHVANVKRILDDAYRDADRAHRMLAYNVEEAQALAAQASAKLGGQIGKQILEKQGIANFANYIAQTKETLFKEEQKREENQLKKERLNIERARLLKESAPSYQYFVGPDGAVRYFNTKNAKDFGTIEGANAWDWKKLGAQAKGGAGLPKKGETQANFVSETLNRPIDVDAAAKVTSGVAYINGLEELREMSKTLGNTPGLTVGIANKIDSVLKQTADANGTVDLSAEAINKAWEQAQDDPSFKALSQKSKVMAKKELDVIMTFLQTKYGNRAPVAEFRAAQQTIARRSADPVAYDQILANEIKSTSERLSGVGFSVGDVNKLRDAMWELQIPKDPVTGFPVMNRKGWMLKGDGKGNYAYMSPSAMQKVQAGQGEKVTKDEYQELE